MSSVNLKERQVERWRYKRKGITGTLSKLLRGTLTSHHGEMVTCAPRDLTNWLASKNGIWRTAMSNNNINLPHKGKKDAFRHLYIFQFVENQFTECIYFLSEKTMARHSSTLAWKIPWMGGAWWAAVHGVSKSQTWLSDFIFTFHFYALEKEMATPSSVLAWRIPGVRSHRVGHDWSDLAVAVSSIYFLYTYCTTFDSSQLMQQIK